ncbi:hypothetical protein AGOR_G00078420 [Albula goreensis]|uniref:Disintegrin and metalloproteinase domain-containing protein 23-like n=1 Tax=Albula goreensis TaxID=1534307 RepID=A0A8T3DT96_9TELE|nr:hypothetical protein AGOR_G00078420 [Albula goreensis]
MLLKFLPNLLASILVSWLNPFGLASNVYTTEENETVRKAVSAALELDAASAPDSDSDNVTRHTAEHAIAYPSRLIYYLNEDSESTYHDLDTRTRTQVNENQMVHLAQVSFQLEAFGTRFILDLTLNNDLLSSDYVEIHYEEGKPVLSKGGEHCYYHGQVRGADDSLVALSTCNGLHGMIDDGVHVYHIEPLKQTHSTETGARPHTLRRSPSQRWTEEQGDLAEEEEEEEEEEQILSDLGDMSWLRRRKKRAIPRSVFEEMKYLEIMIVSDHSMFKRQRTKQHTKNFAKSVVNLVDAVFKDQLYTRVVLVAMEIWTDRNRIPLSVMPLEMLRDFSKYRQHNIKQRADAVHLFSNVTFRYHRSSVAYFGGVCSLSRGVGVNEYGSTWIMASFLSQSLAQNLGIQWDPSPRRKECTCLESWEGCIMEDNGVLHPRKFSRCSISDYKDFLLKGGGSCLFNRPSKLLEATECGNGYVEVGEECDCGAKVECYKECCKKCSLSNGAHCSDGPCCNNTCLFYPRGYSCRYAVNDCDISETCSGDSGQCPPNLHKQDGYSCNLNQGRCYAGECKTRENQCKHIWGSKALASEKFCYEKLNTEGTEKGTVGRMETSGSSAASTMCSVGTCSVPTSAEPLESGRLVDCSGGHVLLDDETDLGYVEDGTPCGPSMMCLDRRCLPIPSLNISACPSGSNGQVCSAHGVCNNEATCTCDTTWAGTDCSMPDPPKEPAPAEEEGPKVSMATNRLIGAVAGTILALGVIFGGTGWGIES